MGVGKVQKKVKYRYISKKEIKIVNSFEALDLTLAYNFVLLHADVSNISLEKKTQIS